MLIMRIHRAAGELREAKWLQWCDDAAVEGGVRGDADVSAGRVRESELDSLVGARTAQGRRRRRRCSRRAQVCVKETKGGLIWTKERLARFSWSSRRSSAFSNRLPRRWRKMARRSCARRSRSSRPRTASCSGEGRVRGGSICSAGCADLV